MLRLGPWRDYCASIGNLGGACVVWDILLMMDEALDVAMQVYMYSNL